jgi:hypothetical protein
MDNTFAVPNVDGNVQELMSDLSDALEILYSCRKFAVPVTDSFLDYIDLLIDRLEAGRPYSTPAA